MTTVPRPLEFQVLIGCAWVDARPEFVRAGDVFRMLRKDGSVYLAAARVLPDTDDAGIYIASANGGENGVPFDVMPPVVGLVAPTFDLGE